MKHTMIVAGAGCGKTTRLISDFNKTDSDSKIIISFSRDTILDIRNRVKTDAKIVTLHSLAFNLIKSHLEKKGITLHISEISDINIGLFRFDDLLSYFCENFDELYKPISYIFVDEFQDLSKMQFDVLMKYKDKGSTLYVIGDPNQCIYSWRNSYDKIFEEFKTICDPIEITLDYTYRCSENIIKISNNILERNGSDLKLRTNNPGGFVVFKYLYNESLLNSKIVQLNEALTKDSSLAILCRTNVLCNKVNQKLSLPSNKVYYKVSKLIEFWNAVRYGYPSKYMTNREAAYLNLLYSGKDKELFEHLVKMISEDYPTFKEYLRDIDKNRLTSGTMIDELYFGILTKNNNPSVTTFHAAKGREFDYVILPFFNNSVFPILSSSLEEERRLLYVAITRARKGVVILSSNEFAIENVSYYTPPSVFVSELFGISLENFSKVYAKEEDTKFMWMDYDPFYKKEVDIIDIIKGN